MTSFLSLSNLLSSASKQVSFFLLILLPYTIEFYFLGKNITIPRKLSAVLRVADRGLQAPMFTRQEQPEEWNIAKILLLGLGLVVCKHWSEPWVQGENDSQASRTRQTWIIIRHWSPSIDGRLWWCHQHRGLPIEECDKCVNVSHRYTNVYIITLIVHRTISTFGRKSICGKMTSRRGYLWVCGPFPR